MTLIPEYPLSESAERFKAKLTTRKTTCVRSAIVLNVKLMVWLAVLVNDQFLRDSTERVIAWLNILIQLEVLCV